MYNFHFQENWFFGKHKIFVLLGFTLKHSFKTFIYTIITKDSPGNGKCSLLMVFYKFYQNTRGEKHREIQINWAKLQEASHRSSFKCMMKWHKQHIHTLECPLKLSSKKNVQCSNDTKSQKTDVEFRGDGWWVAQITFAACSNLLWEVIKKL